MSSESRGVRVAKLIADRGLASRREAESWIGEGRVAVNGTTIDTPALVVDPEHDVVLVDGKRLPGEPRKVWYLFYKPRGYIVTRDDPEGRPSIFDLLGDMQFRVEAVGRLDFDTEGALILTNDGATAHALLHPSREIPKRYRVKTYRVPSDADLDAIRTGVYLEDGKTKPAKCRVVETTKEGNAWLEVTVTEGRNRLVRRMLAQLGHPVSKLRRESFATISIRGMERGAIRPLMPLEVRRLLELADGKTPTEVGRKKRGKGFAKPKPKKPRGGRKPRTVSKPSP